MITPEQAAKIVEDLRSGIMMPSLGVEVDTLSKNAYIIQQYSKGNQDYVRAVVTVEVQGPANGMTFTYGGVSNPPTPDPTFKGGESD